MSTYSDIRSMCLSLMLPCMFYVVDLPSLSESAFEVESTNHIEDLRQQFQSSPKVYKERKNKAGRKTFISNIIYTLHIYSYRCAHIEFYHFVMVNSLNLNLEMDFLSLSLANCK